jgi:hypothetical protein
VTLAVADLDHEINRRLAAARTRAKARKLDCWEFFAAWQEGKDHDEDGKQTAENGILEVTTRTEP